MQELIVDQSIDLLDGLDGKESAYRAEDLDLILGQKNPGEGNVNLLQYFAWRIPRTEALIHAVTRSWTQLSD